MSSTEPATASFSCILWYKKLPESPKTLGVLYRYMFEKSSLCRNRHRPVNLLPYKPEAYHLHDDRCDPGYRIGQE